MSWLPADCGGSVQISALEEVLCRFGFAVIVLSHLKPWLGPLYAWEAATPRGCYLQLPILSKLSLQMILEVLLKGGGMVKVKDVETEAGREFLADTMASGTRVGVDGWESLLGRPKEESPWYAEESTPAMGRAGTKPSGR